MAANEELVEFVREALTRGVSRPDVEAALRQAGWAAADVRAALARFADLGLPVPVPRPHANRAARDAFLYLVVFSTLYVVALNLGSLLFQLIDRWIPDPATGPSPVAIGQAIRWSVSALIVATPVFLYASTMAARETRRHPAESTTRIRRALTYLTLFVAACVLVGDVTALVYNLLGGELTTRFVLKALVVGAIAGTGFRYYLSELRADEQEPAA